MILIMGVDYFDAFAPAAKLASIRAVLAMAAAENMELHQIDIKGAYLNGELTEREKIFMQQPPGQLHWQSLPSSKDLVWLEAIWKALVSTASRDHS
jgi:Reverse transcriptase (RNA-dependent DNA polymerase)